MKNVKGEGLGEEILYGLVMLVVVVVIILGVDYANAMHTMLK